MEDKEISHITNRKISKQPLFTLNNSSKFIILSFNQVAQEQDFIDNI